MVLIDRYVPVLDVALEAAKEFIDCRGVTINTSAQPEFAGLAVDVSYALNRFYPRFRTHLIVKGRYGSRKDFSINVGKPYGIRIVLDETRGFSTETGNLKEKARVHKNSPEGVYMSFVSRKSWHEDYKHGSAIREKLGDILPGTNKLVTLAHYNSIFGFRVESNYQKFGPLNRRGRILEYPVSEKSDYVLEDKYWSFFANPLYWSAESDWIAWEFSVICGEETPESIAKKHDWCGIGFVRRNLEKERRKCYEIIDRDIHEDVGIEAKYLGCPDEFRGMFLHEILKHLRKLANPSTVDTDYVRNLVEAYNREYAGPNKKPDITEKEICETLVYDGHAMPLNNITIHLAAEKEGRT